MSAALLLRPSFRRFYIGQSASVLGDALAWMATAFAVLHLTNSAAAVGIVLLAGQAPLIGLSLVGGAVGDRLSRRAVMLAADSVRLVAQACAGVLLLTGAAEVWMIVATQLVAGTGAAFFLPASQGLVTSLVPRDRLAQANSLLSMSRSVASIVGLTAAAAVIATVGPGWALVIDALTFAVSAGCLYRLPKALTGERLSRDDRLLAAVRTGLAEVRRRSWLWVSIVHLALTNMVMVSPLLVLGPVVADRELGGAPGWAAITVAFAVGGVTGSLLTSRWRPARPLAATLLCSFAGIPLLVLLAIPAPIGVLSVAGLVAGVQQTVYVVLRDTVIQQNIAADRIARVSSVSMLGGLVATPCGMALAGPAADVLGVSQVLLAAAASASVITLAALLAPALWGIRQAAATPTPEPAQLEVAR